MANAKVKKPKTLKELLIKACPADKSGHKSIPLLAEAIGRSRYGVYKWINANRISPDGATIVAKVSEGRVSLATLTPFIFK